MTRTGADMDTGPMRADLTAVYTGFLADLQTEVLGKMPRPFRPSPWSKATLRRFAGVLAAAHTVALAHYSDYHNGLPAKRRATHLDVED